MLIIGRGACLLDWDGGDGLVSEEGVGEIELV